MIKYIVTWCVISTYLTYPPAKWDDYGRLVKPQGSRMDYVEEISNCGYTRTFGTRDSAFTFYKNGKSQKDLVLKIDSIVPTIKKKK